MCNRHFVYERKHDILCKDGFVFTRIFVLKSLSTEGLNHCGTEQGGLEQCCLFPAPPAFALALYSVVCFEGAAALFSSWIFQRRSLSRSRVTSHCLSLRNWYNLSALPEEGVTSLFHPTFCQGSVFSSKPLLPSLGCCASEALLKGEQMYNVSLSSWLLALE